jgi:hypothetical protein
MWEEARDALKEDLHDWKEMASICGVNWDIDIDACVEWLNRPENFNKCCEFVRLLTDLHNGIEEAQDRDLLSDPRVQKILAVLRKSKYDPTNIESLNPLPAIRGAAPELPTDFVQFVLSYINDRAEAGKDIIGEA